MVVIIEIIVIEVMVLMVGVEIGYGSGRRGVVQERNFLPTFTFKAVNCG